MTDRELLEAAAKAAGVPIFESDDGTVQKRPIWVVKCGGGNGTMPYEWPWNPLEDDGDALRLAVKLGLLIDTQDEDRDGCYPCSSALQTSASWRYEKHGNDPYAATRRAIVRAAAEIGKSLP